ncbi:MAG: SRPBCC family protein [Bacteroidia bacterium]
MKIYTLKTKQIIPVSLDEAWDFFSSPKNLKTITPPYMGFDITSETEEKMYAGQIITYTVRPLFNIPMTWVTEITHVKDKEFFVDEQRFGPYALWHHKHFFKEIEKGVEMTDRVDYALPLGILGQIAHPIIVKNKLKEIFDFRYKKVEELFGKV